MATKRKSVVNPAPRPPHGVGFSYDTYPDGKKIPLGRHNKWKEYKTEPYWDRNMDLRDTIWMLTYFGSDKKKKKELDNYRARQLKRHKITLKRSRPRKGGDVTMAKAKRPRKLNSFGRAMKKCGKGKHRKLGYSNYQTCLKAEHKKIKRGGR